MPALNIDELIEDPDFLTEGLTLVRTTSVVPLDGIPQLFKTHFPLTAIISPMRSKQLERMPEGFNTNGAISAISRTSLSAGDARTNEHADQIIWKDSLYLVKAVNDYEDWGIGFIEAFCERQGINTL